MAVTKSPRTGRRPGESGTRDAILAAACERFQRDGYDGTTVRGVAAQAGVDAALVMHYFKTKGGLFAAAIRWPEDPQETVEYVTALGRDHVGSRAVARFVQIWDREGDRNPIIALLASAMRDAAAADMLRGFLQRQLLGQVVARIDADEPHLRANLVASQLVGLGVARYVLKLEPLASLPPERVVAAIAPRVQQYVTGPLG
jgi:AcrR family transcriptional regulator